MPGHIFARYKKLYGWLAILVLYAHVLACMPVQAASAELTGPELATGQFQISADSRYVVYAANSTGTNSFRHLYSVPLAGGAPVQLNLTVPDGSIYGYAIGAQGQWVVYQLNSDLYSVPVAGPASASVKLNSVALSSSVQHTFSISTDGTHVVYRTSTDLYSVPVNGPAAATVQLNMVAPLAADLGVPGVATADFAISPHSQQVAYVAQTGPSAFGLYSVPIGGPASASLLLSSPTPGADIDWFRFSVDSQYLVYISDQETDMRFELYSAPVAGSAASVKLNRPLQEGETVYNVAVSADSVHVVYVKGYELYSVPIGGPASASVRLNDEATAARIDLFEISADGQWVVFQVNELYGVPIGGPASARVQLTEMGSDGRLSGQFQIGPDSQYVIYTGYAQATSPLELYSVALHEPIDAGIKLNRALETAAQPLFFTVSPDGQSVVYEAYQDAANQNELYGVPASGPASLSVKISGSEAQTSGIQPLHWQISPDSSQVVYVVGSDLYVADNYAQQVHFAPELRHTYLPMMSHQ